MEQVGRHFPFYSVKFRKDCSALLKKELIDMGLVKDGDMIDEKKFFEFVLKDKI